MTSKERVLTAINLQKPDQIPCSFISTDSVTNRLKENLGVRTYRELLERLGSDTVDIRGFVDPIWNGPYPQIKTLKGGITENYLGFHMKEVQTQYGPVQEHCGCIFESCEDPEELDSLFVWPKVDWFDFSSVKERLGEYRDLAIVASGASVYQHPTIVRGIDNFLVDMVANEAFANALMDKYTDFYLEYFERLFEAADGSIDIMRIADDLGMQDRPMFSLALFQKYIKPRVGKLVYLAHSFGIKVLFHSCGSIVPFIEELIEIGVDILDPIQTRAKGMDPAFIKSGYGNRICLHGSIDTQYTLPKGTVQDVEKEVRDRIEILGPEGFILAPSHVLQPDVPLENILALYDTVRRQQA